MKKIAFTQRLIEAESYRETRDALDIRWAELCTTLHVLPVILPSSYDVSCYFNEFEIAGIILTGGNDLASVLHSTLSLKRDAFEKSVLHYAIEHHIPVFGVCRGMQLIAEYFGAAIQRVENHISTRHKMVSREYSRYFDLGSSPETVNSYHGYAVSALPECLYAVATDDAGIIEAFEHINLPLAAQMWHPERETPFKHTDLVTLRKLFGLGDDSE